MVKLNQSIKQNDLEPDLFSGKKIFWVTILNAVITSGSLALLSDAVHNLSDTIAISMSYFDNRIAQNQRIQKS